MIEFGVEQEHFVLHDDASPPTHVEIDEFYRRLAARGFRTSSRTVAGRMLAVECEFGGTKVKVTNDACTHLLEFVFPPLDDLQSFRSLYEALLPIVQDALSSLGLVIRHGGFLDPPPAPVHWRFTESDPEGRRLSATLTRPASNSRFYRSAIPACIAATQVSLTIPAEDAYPRLRDYYAFEFLVPLYFSNSRRFSGFEARCVRPLSLAASIVDCNPMVGVPRRIPTSAEEYRRECERCLLRDYSFVSVRSSNRLEFRSACSQSSIDAIVDLIGFRQAVAAAVSGGIEPVPFDSAEVFEAACLGSSDLPLEWALRQLAPHGFSRRDVATST
jgi:hypothetical protein